VTVERDVALAPLTTFGLGGAARYFVTARTEEQLIGALRFAQEQRLAAVLLGGGSNLVVSDAGWDGVVIRIASRGVESERAGERVRLTVQAGEPWDELVAMSVAQGLSGLECLSGIPGLTGATPIQNVGAYGCEVADVIESVRVVERATLAVSEIAASECGFGYRTSAFKRDKERWAVLGVRFVLAVGGAAKIAYSELARALAPGAERDLAAVRATVLGLRRQKSMVLDAGDENRRSAGSFFLNPIVPEQDAVRVAEYAVAEGLCARVEEVPRYAAEGGVKLAAGWLIERSGLHKGMRSTSGTFGLSSRHALSIVHHGGGSSAELIAFARELRARVLSTFGIQLEPEPVFLGFAPDFVF
jgi:UDP-N-acetylmuramate dehydrogenase